MMSTLSTAFIAFGGNLGDPVETLLRALPMVRERVGEIAKLSSLYETKALTLGGEVYPNYINAVMQVASKEDPETILGHLLAIEKSLGRDRSRERRWEPRTIDLDLLFVDSLELQTPALTLPHPEIAKRDFVMCPLAEIAPHFVHPSLSRTMSDLWAYLERDESNKFVLRKRSLPS